MDFLTYCWRVIALAFGQSLDTAQTVIFVLIIVAGIASHYIPGFKMTADLSGWQVATGILGLVVIVRLILAPYWLWQEEHTARLVAENKAPIATPAKNRNKIVAALGGFYASGSALQRKISNQDVTDDQIDTFEQEADKWLNDTATWIQSNMGAPAVSRFINNSDKNAGMYIWKGEHSAAAREKRNTILVALSGCLTNIETMMKSDQWDSQ